MERSIVRYPLRENEGERGEGGVSMSHSEHGALRLLADVHRWNLSSLIMMTRAVSLCVCVCVCLCVWVCVRVSV